MKLAAIRSERDRIQTLFKDLQAESAKVQIKTLSVFSQFMAVKAAGFVELSLQQTIFEYADKRSNRTIAGYILERANRLNSLNCDKIRNFLEPFDATWWPEIEKRSGQKIIGSIDSLKNVRDDVAHGKHNGTGIAVIGQYFSDCVVFSGHVQDVILT